VKYAMIDLSKIQNGVQITHDDLQSYYNSHRDQYRVTEQAKVQPHSDQDPASRAGRQG